MVKSVLLVGSSNAYNLNESTFLRKKPQTFVQQKSTHDTSIYKTKGFVGNFYGAKIHKSSLTFKGYYGNSNPARKLFWILTGRSSVYEDGWTKMHLFHGSQAGWKKWVVAHPAELLKRTAEQAIQSICTLTKRDHSLPDIPNGIFSPNYGDTWGRHATYIEVNPRAIALQDGARVREGFLSAIKLLPAIPASQRKSANCVILSGFYPTIYGDGYSKVMESSFYTVNLYSGISRCLTSDGLFRDGQRMGDDELTKAFNDLAHMRGLKTGIRMPLSEGQIKVQGRDFYWHNRGDQEAFINACVDAVDMGFDAIYFDSAKHCGGYDMRHYCGCGALPDYGQMQYITSEIRRRTGRRDLSFIGEKGNNDIGRFKNMGLTAGTDWGRADDIENVKWESRMQAHSRDYAAGPEVSNDNDQGNIPYEQRLHRLRACLFGYHQEDDRLPCFMQMHDLFPLSWAANTHDLMMHGRSFSAFGDATSHWNNLFDSSDASHWYRHRVNQEFAAAA